MMILLRIDINHHNDIDDIGDDIDNDIDNDIVA